MNSGDDFRALHEDFHQAARSAYEQAADGPQKDDARWHFSLAEAAGLNKNEVDWLLAIHRAIRALGRY